MTDACPVSFLASIGSVLATHRLCRAEDEKPGIFNNAGCHGSPVLLE